MSATTVQQTSKRIKGVQLVCMVGIVMFTFIAWRLEWHWTGLAMLAPWLIGFLYIRFLAWWHHG